MDSRTFGALLVCGLLGDLFFGSQEEVPPQKIPGEAKPYTHTSKYILKKENQLGQTQMISPKFETMRKKLIEIKTAHAKKKQDEFNEKEAND